MADRINQFFDLIKLVTKRLPDVGEFIVQIVLLGLVVLGAWALFRAHP
jgi:hypothetical protein